MDRSRRSNARRRLEDLEEETTRPGVLPPRRAGILHIAVKGILGGLAFLAALAILVTAVLSLVLYRYAHPPRIVSAETPATLFTLYEDVSFTSADGVPLAGWWIPGKDGLPVLILCHDRGESMTSLLGMAARLSAEHYPILLFDFRGHGGSGGTSSFGTLEKRDLLGAIDWAESRSRATGGRMGIVGVGMGAYAAILAAAERPHARCLVLDSPYGEASAQFAISRMPTGLLRRCLARWSTLLYDTVYRVRSSEESAARRVADLSDRNLLILAPKDDEVATGAARAMYESISEARHNFKNLELLAATRTSSLYGEDRQRYDEKLMSFFRSYLPADPPASPPSATRSGKLARR